MEHDVSYTRVGIEDLLKSMGEDELTEEVTLADQVTYIVGQDAVHENEDQDEGDDVAYSAADEQKALAIATQALERQGIFSTDVRIAIRTCQKRFRLEKQAALHQKIYRTPSVGIKIFPHIPVTCIICILTQGYESCGVILYSTTYGKCREYCNTYCDIEV